MIATCSFDRTAAVWEEIPGAQAGSAQSHWMKKAPLVDSRLENKDRYDRLECQSDKNGIGPKLYKNENTIVSIKN